jgi:hypothetical protein
MEKKIYKLTEDLSQNFNKGDLVYKESDFPVHYLVRCDEKGWDIIDKEFEDPIFYDWHPMCEKECPWENKLELYKVITE